MDSHSGFVVLFLELAITMRKEGTSISLLSMATFFHSFLSFICIQVTAVLQAATSPALSTGTGMSVLNSNQWQPLIQAQLFLFPLRN